MKPSCQPPGCHGQIQLNVVALNSALAVAFSWQRALHLALGPRLKVAPRSERSSRQKAAEHVAASSGWEKYPWGFQGVFVARISWFTLQAFILGPPVGKLIKAGRTALQNEPGIWTRSSKLNFLSKLCGSNLRSWGREGATDLNVCTRSPTSSWTLKDGATGFLLKPTPKRGTNSKQTPPLPQKKQPTPQSLPTQRTPSHTHTHPYPHKTSPSQDLLGWGLLVGFCERFQQWAAAQRLLCIDAKLTPTRLTWTLGAPKRGKKVVLAIPSRRKLKWNPTRFFGGLPQSCCL